MKKLTDMTKFIREKLDISDRYLANLIGVPSWMLVEKEANIVTDQMCLPRLEKMVEVIQHLETKNLTRKDILECLTNPCFADIQDRQDSVTSAIMQNKYPTEILIEISNLAASEL